MMANVINILKRTVAIAMSTICGLAGLCISEINTDAYALTDENTAIYEEMLEEVNEYRAEYGIEALKLDYNLCETAEIRSQELTELFSHVRPDGRSSFSVFSDCGISIEYAGENVAYHYLKSASAIMEAWMNSSGHRANILNPDYQYIAVGLYEKDGYYYWTQIFYTPMYQEDYNINLTSGYDCKVDSEENEITVGDVNKDGSIDASDASEVLSIYSQLSSGEIDELDSEMIKRADVNNDGMIDASDSSSILSYYSMLSKGIEPKF